MLYLYEVEDNGATFWAVAPDELAAKALVASVPDRDDFDADPEVVRKLSRDEAINRTFRIDGTGETCSMWFAYLLVREAGSCVLACSEWP